MILHQTKHGLNQSQQKIHGLLFDVAWLWEEYLATLLPEFEHPQNKSKSGGYSLFESGDGRIYPDFLSLTDCPIVADAKYKPIENINGSDYLQLVAYMYRFNARLGFYLFPNNKNDANNSQFNLLQGKGEGRDTKIIVKKVGLEIPQTSSSYDDFVKQIQELEKIFQETIQKLLNESECTL